MKRAVCRSCARIDRRAFFGLLLAGVAVAGAEQFRSALGGPNDASHTPAAHPDGSVTATPGSNGVLQLPMETEFAVGSTPAPTAESMVGSPTLIELGAIPSPRPGPATVIAHGPTDTSKIAITIDDGFCVPCATFYVNLAQASGIHLTLSPNGTYKRVWEPLASTIRSLVETGQVQIANHTYNHSSLVGLSDSAIRDQINRNEDWIQSTFGITSRPWFRPPYGNHTPHTDALAGELGFTRILMWNGSFGDSTPISTSEILALATKYMKPGSIILGHANYPTIESLWDQIQGILGERGLQPVTLDEMFGTSRTVG